MIYILYVYICTYIYMYTFMYILMHMHVLGSQVLPRLTPRSLGWCSRIPKPQQVLIVTVTAFVCFVGMWAWQGDCNGAGDRVCVGAQPPIQTLDEATGVDVTVCMAMGRTGDAPPASAGGTIPWSGRGAGVTADIRTHSWHKSPCLCLFYSSWPEGLMQFLIDAGFKCPTPIQAECASWACLPSATHALHSSPVRLILGPYSWTERTSISG